MHSSFRSSHRPLFVRMTPLQSDWSPMGLKGIIPSLLHHTLLGYNFLIPDAVGNTTGCGPLFSLLLAVHRQTNFKIVEMLRTINLDKVTTHKKSERNGMTCTYICHTFTECPFPRVPILK